MADGVLRCVQSSRRPRSRRAARLNIPGARLVLVRPRPAPRGPLSLETLVEEDGSRKILAMAFDTSDRALSDLQYGGSLEYDPGNGRIMTLDERRGLQATEADEGTYYIRVQESETAVAPVRNWLIAYIVFPGEPTGTDVKTAVSKEIEKLKPRGLDVNLRIYSGDKSNKITWKQIKAPNGKYMGVEYVFATGGILPSWDWD